MSCVETEKIMAECKKVYEAFHYSDLLGKDALEPIEKGITTNLKCIIKRL